MRRTANPLPASDPRRDRSPGHRRPGRRVGAAGAALALLAAAVAGAGVILSVPARADDADPSGPGPAPEVVIAEQLLRTIPPGSRIALRPLFPRETGLPEAEGRQIYELVLGALLRAAEGRLVTLLARERLAEVYRSQEDFFHADIASLLRDAQADVEVICHVSPIEDGVTLSCTAVKTAVAVGYGVAQFPLERREIPLSLALAAIARRLAEEVPHAGSVERVSLIDSSFGFDSNLGAFIGQRLEREVSRKMWERERQETERARADAVLRDAPAPSGPAPAYRLTGTIWRTGGESLWLEARLRIGRGCTPRL